jgi:uncharacterized GH25 family protein
MIRNTNMNFLNRTLVPLLLLAFVSQSQAHGIWFAQRSGEIALIYGHGAEDLDMIKRYDKVTEVAAFDLNGVQMKTGLRKTDHLAIADLSAKPTILTAVLDNGYWSKGLDGKWVNKGKDEVVDSKESGRYVKYTVRLLEPLTKSLPLLPNQVLQIVPVKAKLPDHMNEVLVVRILFKGKPAIGAKVINDYVTDPDQKPVVVGKDGIVSVRVRNQGLNVIAASFDAPPDDAVKASKNGLHATLAFVLQHAPE